MNEDPRNSWLPLLRSSFSLKASFRCRRHRSRQQHASKREFDQKAFEMTVDTPVLPEPTVKIALEIDLTIEEHPVICAVVETRQQGHQIGDRLTQVDSRAV